MKPSSFLHDSRISLRYAAPSFQRHLIASSPTVCGHLDVHVEDAASLWSSSRGNRTRGTAPQLVLVLAELEEQPLAESVRISHHYVTDE